jgi:1,4-dihydroxy-2-naphthoate octaprenyltransferase
MFYRIVELLKLSSNPATIIYPYPFLALLAFSLSEVFDIISLFKAIFLSFLFCAGINLWNHVNDIKEDIFAGKKTILTENPEIRNLVAVISALLYAIAFFLSILWTVDKRGIVAFVGAAFATWIYSDRMIIGRKVRRWKNHYVTELLAYIIFAPSITLLLWTLFAPLSPKSFALSIIITFLMLSGTFLKDIKDISGDKLAGLKTLGVVFSPESLLKTSFVLLGFYYLSISVFSLFGMLPLACVFSVLASFGLAYTLRHFLNNGWTITLKSIKPIKVMVYSNLTSLSILIIAGFTQIPELLKFRFG